MTLNYSFAGKNVLVTGGGRGVGRKLVERFYEDGAKVFTVDKDPELIKELKKDLPNVTAEVVDLSDWEATKKVVESFGSIDHLVNNAGIIPRNRFFDITPESLQKAFEVNLFASINVTQVVTKRLIEEGKQGTIVNMSSLTAKKGMASMPIYTATKASIENMTKSMALELGAHGIRVNCILPGLIDTPVHAPYGGLEAIKGYILPRQVVKKLITTDDAAKLIMFLLSPLSEMIVGEGVVLDGGYDLS